MKNEPNNIYMPFKKGGVVTNHFQMSSPLNHAQNNNFYLIGVKSDISYLTNKKRVKLLKEFDVSFSSSAFWRFYEVIF